MCIKQKLYVKILVSNFITSLKINNVYKIVKPSRHGDTWGQTLWVVFIEFFTCGEAVFLDAEYTTTAGYISPKQ